MVLFQLVRILIDDDGHANIDQVVTLLSSSISVVYNQHLRAARSLTCSVPLDCCENHDSAQPCDVVGSGGYGVVMEWLH